jgi:hypothetical protein
MAEQNAKTAVLMGGAIVTKANAQKLGSELFKEYNTIGLSGTTIVTDTFGNTFE